MEQASRVRLAYLPARRWSPTEALQPQRPDDFEYQEEDLRGPTRYEVRKFLLGMREVVVPGRHHEEPVAPQRDDWV